MARKALHSHMHIGYTATVFGATGFLGRYIVNRLGASGPSRQKQDMALMGANSPFWMHSHCALP